MLIFILALLLVVVLSQGRCISTDPDVLPSSACDVLSALPACGSSFKDALSEAYFHIIGLLLAQLQTPTVHADLLLREKWSSALVLLSNLNFQAFDLATLNRNAMMALLRPLLLLSPELQLPALSVALSASPPADAIALAQSSSWALRYSSFSLFRLLSFFSTHFELDKMEPTITAGFQALRDALIRELHAHLTHGLALIKAAAEAVSLSRLASGQEEEDEEEGARTVPRMSEIKEISRVDRSSHRSALFAAFFS